MSKILLSIAFFICFMNITIYSQCTYTATTNGDWESASTWVKSNCPIGSPNIPTNNSTVIIPVGMTVTLNSNTTYTQIIISVSGVLLFDIGVKMNIDCNSQIKINASGFIDGVGNNNGEKIAYCNSGWIWNGNPTSGPTTIGNASLPIELSKFEVINIDNYNVIYWETSSEVNNAYFELYHSSDVDNWVLIDKIIGAGNSNVLTKYEYIHKSFNSGVNYYKLKQVDTDGENTYSKIISINNVYYIDEVVYIYNTMGQEVTSDCDGIKILHYKSGRIEKKY